MRRKLKYLLLPLFCLSVSLSSCNSGANQVKKIIETEYATTWNNVEDIHVREIHTETYTFYEVYVYTKFKNSKGGYTYGVTIYVYDNGKLEWIYSK